MLAGSNPNNGIGTQEIEISRNVLPESIAKEFLDLQVSRAEIMQDLDELGVYVATFLTENQIQMKVSLELSLAEIDTRLAELKSTYPNIALVAGARLVMRDSL